MLGRAPSAYLSNEANLKENKYFNLNKTNITSQTFRVLLIDELMHLPVGMPLHNSTFY